MNRSVPFDSGPSGVRPAAWTILDGAEIRDLKLKKGPPEVEWYCKITARIGAHLNRFKPYFCNEAEQFMHVLAKSVACGWRLALLTSEAPKLEAKPPS